MEINKNAKNTPFLFIMVIFLQKGPFVNFQTHVLDAAIHVTLDTLNYIINNESF